MCKWHNSVLNVKQSAVYAPCRSYFLFLFFCSDIAIGAPYEDDNKGVVYVYNGYPGGLWPKYSQRIAAVDISTGLAGFGISISNAADINSDNIEGNV